MVSLSWFQFQVSHSTIQQSACITVNAKNCLTRCIPVLNQVSAERPVEIKSLKAQELVVAMFGPFRGIGNTGRVTLSSPEHVIVD